MNDKSAALARLLAAVALTAVSTLAHAQFKWVDENGTKHFSDRPPPTSVPLKNILQAPGQPRGKTAALTETPSAETKPAEPSAPPKAASPTIAERNADYRKRVKEQADKEAKEKQEADIKAANADNCVRAREAKQVLDSGQPIGTLDKNGERSVMDDARREQERKRVNTMLAACTTSS